MHFLSLCVIVLVTSLALTLLMWMIVHPVTISDVHPKPVPPPGDWHDHVSDMEEGCMPECPDEGWPLSEGGALRRAGPQTTSPPMWRDATPPPAPFRATRFDVPEPGFAARMATRLRAALSTSGAMPAAREAMPTSPALTHALLLAHTVDTQQHAPLPPAWGADAAAVPRALVDWRSAEARRARWLRACQEMTSARSEVSVAVTELSKEGTMASTTSTVAGGGKGHAMGRAARKQLALLLCAVWRIFYDTFGMAAAGVPRGGALVLEVCDALDEIGRLKGIETLLMWQEPAEDAAAAPGVLPQVHRALRLHMNAAWQLAQAGSALRTAVAAAASESEWLQAATRCDAWPPVLSALHLAWYSSGQPHDREEGVVDVASRMQLSFGLWCTAVLLQLSAIEPRPELWGRYVAALNHLQGAVRGSQSVGAHAGAVGTHAALLGLVHAVEAHVKATGAAGGTGGAGHAAAFAQGKCNLMSVVKRYKALLAWSQGEGSSGGGRSRGRGRPQETESRSTAGDRWVSSAGTPGRRASPSASRTGGRSGKWQRSTLTSEGSPMPSRSDVDRWI